MTSFVNQSVSSQESSSTGLTQSMLKGVTPETEGTAIGVASVMLFGSPSKNSNDALQNLLVLHIV